MAVNFLLVGRNGNGKSSIGNTILEGKFFKPNSHSESSIDNILSGKKEIDGKMITVVDGPFIKDTNLNDPDDITLALDCGKKAMELCPDGFDGVVIVLKYGVRFTQQEKDAIFLIRAMFGDNVIKDHGICAFSYGDSFARDMEEDGTSFESWCMDQTGDVADLFKECSNRYIIFNNRDDESTWYQRRTLLSYVDKLLGNRYSSNEYEQAETGRNGLKVKSKRSGLDEETRKVLDDISVALGHINIHGNSDYSKKQIMQMKEKLENHKAYIEQEASGTQLLDNIFNNIKVTEMNLDTKLKLADVVSQTRQREQPQRTSQVEENTDNVSESTHIFPASEHDSRESSWWEWCVRKVRGWWEAVKERFGYRN